MFSLQTNKQTKRKKKKNQEKEKEKKPQKVWLEISATTHAWMLIIYLDN
jgi:hypothetical protein